MRVIFGTIFIVNWIEYHSFKAILSFQSDVGAYCVPERTGTGESAAKSKNVSAILMILFLISYVFYLGSLYKKIFWIN